MSVLVVCEHDHHHVKPATLATITAASKLSDDIHILVAGHQCQAVVEACRNIAMVKKVLSCDASQLAHHFAETLTHLILPLKASYTHFLAPATTFGKNLMPRVAALMDIPQVSEISEVVMAPNRFKRPIYAGNAIQTVEVQVPQMVLTVRATNFTKAQLSGGNASVETLPTPEASKQVEFVSIAVSESARPELTSARIVIAGGRGVGSKENFAIIERLADKLGAAVGASRAAVDAGFVPNDYQVGQTGKIVAPELYLAIGISGAIQHLAGMKESKVIVAINQDENAPIFEIADYGLVMDLFKAIPELEALL